jgi:hypothetical protein
LDWIKGIQSAIDYTEAHLTGEIDYDAAAKQACSSSYLTLEAAGGARSSVVQAIVACCKAEFGI